MINEEERIIIKMHNNGNSQRKIAKFLRCRRQKIYKILKKYDLIRKRVKKLSKQQEFEIIEKYKSGKGLIIIAKEYHIWRPRIRKILTDSGVKIKIVKYKGEICETLKNLYENSGICMMDICKLANVTYKVLSRLIKQNGWKRIVQLKIKPRKRYDTLLEQSIAKHGEAEGKRRHIIYMEKLRKASSGENNPMYGKPTPKKAGKGWSGHFRDIYFRSLRELSYMLYCECENIPLESAENIKIDYEFNNKNCTYRPDFISNKKIIEIKPKRLINTPRVSAKTEGAKKYCEKHGLEYEIMDFEIDADLILHAYEVGLVKFDKNYAEKIYKFCYN